MNFRNVMVASLLVLTAAAVVEAAPPKVSASTRLKLRTKYYTPRPEIIGTTGNGSYKLAGDRVLLVATEFRGEFTHSAAERAFLNASNFLRNNNQTVLTRRYNRRLADDRHVVYGFYNITRDEYGYVAFRIFTDGRSGQIIKTLGATRMINDWHYESWETNGFNVTIQIADDDRGGVAAIFHSLK